MNSKGRQIPQQPKILIISDFVSHTGFARISELIAEGLLKDWDVHICAINYFGDYTELQKKYKIYPASLGGDVFGIQRLPSLLQNIKPDLVFVINDVWLGKEYINAIKEIGAKAVLYTPVDSPNIRRDFVEPVNMYDIVIAYNNFGLNEMQKSGLATQSEVIPHGVNTKIFNPIGRTKARSIMKIPEDWYIVGCANRSQPRKRIDLAVQYFAEWVKDKPDNIKFYFHGALKDLGIDVVQLCQYFDIEDRLIITSPNMTPAQGVPIETLNIIYNGFDVHMSTTLGEGMGYTNMESMAAGIPNIVPDWSALGEWCRDESGIPVVEYVPVTSIYVNTGGINTIGGVADKNLYIAALEKLYTDEKYRLDLGKRGYQLVTQPCYNNSNVAARFNMVFKKLLQQGGVSNASTISK